MTAQFIKGIRLAELFYTEAVQPIIAARYPDLAYTACLIGTGSEILGFDTEMSADHHWGARLMLFLSDDDHAKYSNTIKTLLKHHLPYDIRGHSTNWSAPDPNDGGVQMPELTTQGIVNHRVEINTLDGFTQAYLGINANATLTLTDWLTIPAQKLRTITAGAVYHDGIGDLTALREQVAYYPHDVWLYLMVSGWMRISQEEHLLGRAGYVGDELGARLIGARLVHDIMNLCFLMEKQYAPYSKWFGTAFNLLDCAEAVSPHLDAVLSAQTWQTRQEAIIPAYELLAEKHNTLAITDKIETSAIQFHTRPFMVSRANDIINVLTAKIKNDAVKHLAKHIPIGAVEQFSTSTDFLSHTRITRKAVAVYQDKAHEFTNTSQKK